MKFEQIVVVGCGGIGGWLIPPLLKNLEGWSHPIVFADGDRVERKNLARQNFTESMLGAFKAETFVEASELDVACFSDYVGPDNVAQLVTERSLVLAGPDNHACRRVLAEQCEKLDACALIVGGNEENDGNVSCHVRWEGADLTLPLRARHPEIFQADRSSDRSAMSCAELAALPGGGQTLAANFMCAAIMLNLANLVLNSSPRGRTPLRSDPLKFRPLPSDVYFDLQSGEVSSVYEAKPGAER